MSLLVLLAPLFLFFEVWQLVISERYLGIKQIARGADPRTLGLGEATAFFWSSTIVVYWVWMLLLLTLPIGRVVSLVMLITSVTGYLLRRGCRLKWVLVILTFEGAFRIGMLLALMGLAWRQL
jgi:hypothetical protein